MSQQEVDKILLFEYIIFKLLEWRNNNTQPLFTRIEALKLLFFTSAASIQTTKDDECESLLSIYNNFHAMQHGLVESDIYNAMVRDSTSFYDFTTLHTTIKVDVTHDTFKDFNSNYRTWADDAVDKLKELNSDIVNYEPFQLVDISHKWNSWNISFQMAAILNKRSQHMESKLIEGESGNKNLYYL